MKTIKQLIIANNLTKRRAHSDNEELQGKKFAYASFTDGTHTLGAFALGEDDLEAYFAENGVVAKTDNMSDVLEAINEAARKMLFSTVDVQNPIELQALKQLLPGVDPLEIIERPELSFDRGESTYNYESPSIPLVSEYDDKEVTDEDVKRKFNARAYVLAGMGAAAAGLGLYHLIDHLAKEKQNIIQNNIDIDELSANEKFSLSVNELIDKITNPEQRELLTRVHNAYQSLYTQARMDDNFRLEEDEDSYLTFNHDELIALDLVLNDHSRLMGDKYPAFIASLGYQENDLKANYLSAWQKYQTYMMNATKPSTLSSLILDFENRKLFEEMENSVLTYNGVMLENPDDMNLQQEAATEIWKNVYYNYVIAGATGNYQHSIGQQGSVRSSVAHFAYAAPHGVMMASRNIPEHFIVKLDNETEKARVQLGEAFLENGTEFLPLLNGIDEDFLYVIENEDVNKDYDPLARGANSIHEVANARGLCQDVFTHIAQVSSDINDFRNNEMLAASNSKIQAKNILVSKLISMNEHEAASRINTAPELNDALFNEVSTNRNVREAINEYNAAVVTLDNNSYTIDDFRAKVAWQEYYDKTINLPASVLSQEDRENLVTEEEAMVNLTNNRFRNMQKDLVRDAAQVEVPVVSHGETQTVTKEVQVSKEDLSKELQEEATRQENIIQAEIARDNTPAEATEDATTYANSTRYELEAGTELDKYNLRGTGLTYYNTQRHLAAFEGRQINVRQDQQIIQAAADDFDAYLGRLDSKTQSGLQSLYGDSWKDTIKEVYNVTWMNTLSEITAKAYNEGIADKDKIVSNIRGRFEEAQRAVDELNKSVVTEVDKAPTHDAPAPDKVPEETHTTEEVTPEVVVPTPEVVEEEVVVPEIADPNVDVSYEETEVAIPEITPAPTPEPKVEETPVYDEPEVPVQNVDVPGIDHGSTPEQGGQELSADDLAEIERLRALQEAQERAEETVVNVEENTGPRAVPAFPWEANSQSQTVETPAPATPAPQAPSQGTPAFPTPAPTDPIMSEVDDLSFIEEEVEVAEPTKTR